jgi:hypothetical protein
LEPFSSFEPLWSLVLATIDSRFQQIPQIELVERFGVVPVPDGTKIFFLHIKSVEDDILLSENDPWKNHMLTLADIPGDDAPSRFLISSCTFHGKPDARRGKTQIIVQSIHEA